MKITHSMFEYFDQGSVKRGQDYFRRGHVVVAEWQDETMAVAKCRGSLGSVYKLQLSFDKFGVDGSCSCPVGNNCKHAVAVLFKLLDDQTKKHSIGSKVQSQMPLPHGLKTWVEQGTKTKSFKVSGKPSKDCLVYLLRAMRSYEENSPHFPALMLAIKRGKRDLQGRPIDQLRNYGFSEAFHNPPTWFESEDHVVVNAAITLQRSAGWYGQSDLAVKGKLGMEMLLAAIQTGRCFFGDVATSSPVSLGEERDVEFSWQEQSDGSYHPSVSVAGDHNQVLLVDNHGLMALDLTTRVMTPLVLQGPHDMTAFLATAPAIAARYVDASRDAIETLVPLLPSLAIPEKYPVERISERPRPHLTLFGILVKQSHSSWRKSRDAEKQLIGAARLRFDYPRGNSVAEGIATGHFRKLENGRMFVVQRDFTNEKKFSKTLSDAHLVPVNPLHYQIDSAQANMRVIYSDAAAWQSFVLDIIPKLEADGWNIDIDASFPFRVIEPDGDIELVLEDDGRDKSGIDWFSLDVGVKINGAHVDLTDILVRMLAEGQMNMPVDQQPLLVKLPDGTFLSLPAERVRTILDVMLNFMAGEKRPRVRSRDATLLDGLDVPGLVFRGGEQLRAMGKILREQGGMPVIDVPRDFHAVLRPYQQSGLNWLSFLQGHKFGAVLADDMGLGKTVQALAMVTYAKSVGLLKQPVLLVAPTSLLPNWKREAARFAPGLNVLVSHGLDRRQRMADFAGQDVVITSYPLLTRDHEVLKAQAWSWLIMDESQVLKNPKANMTQTMATLQAEWRLALSGTPIENSLSELWSIFQILNPGLLGDSKFFQKHFRTPIEKRGDQVRANALAARVRPFILRRTKEQVAKDLPAKTIITETVELGEVQRDLYESVRLLMQRKVREALAKRGLAQSHIVILDALLKMRQAALHTALVKDAVAKGKKQATISAKLTRLMELLTTLHEERRRVVVFSQFTSMLDLIEPELRNASLDFVRLDGSSKDRGSIIEQFQDSTMPVFLASLKAGGVGLNLTAADSVILFDPWWNPAVEDQAIDRVHRIGQNNPVFVYRLIAANTIEEKMEILKDKKRGLAASIFDADGQVTAALTVADVDALLA